MMIMNHLKLLSSSNSAPAESEELADVNSHAPVQPHVRAPVHVPSTVPIPLPIEGINETNCLPSSEINRAILHPLDDVLDRLPKTTL